MLQEPDKIQGMEKDRFYLIITIMVLAILFSSSSTNGVFSGAYSITNLVASIIILIFYYAIIVSIMYALGDDPSKFELIFIPTIIIGVTLLGMNLLNITPTVNEDGNDGNGETQSQITATDITGPTGNPTGTTNDGSIVTGTDEQFSAIAEFASVAVVTIIVLTILGLIIYFYMNRTKYIPQISLANEIEYTKSEFQSNKDIIELYVQASQDIEKIKGEAPQWFSPTFFAYHISQNPGPPLSSYFDRLTVLYEWARFSDREMKPEEVREAGDISFEITNQLTRIKELIRGVSIE